MAVLGTCSTTSSWKILLIFYCFPCLLFHITHALHCINNNPLSSFRNNRNQALIVFIGENCAGKLTEDEFSLIFSFMGKDTMTAVNIKSGSMHTSVDQHPSAKFQKSIWHTGMSLMLTGCYQGLYIGLYHCRTSSAPAAKLALTHSPVDTRILTCKERST